MGWAGRIASIAMLAGLVTLVFVAPSDPPAPRASAPAQISGADAGPDYGDTLRRCRTVAVADPECEAAWEAKRRHFFGQGEEER